jgi:hypothetical protein
VPRVAGEPQLRHARQPRQPPTHEQDLPWVECVEPDTLQIEDQGMPASNVTALSTEVVIDVQVSKADECDFGSEEAW